MPAALILAFLANLFLLEKSEFYAYLFLVQVAFYSLAALGYWMQERKTKQKWLYLPFYFVFMHACVVKGWFRFAKGKQAVTWEKAKRVNSLASN
jgi:hypothetical protein